MYKLCKTERSAKRQRRIECALLDLMQKQHYDEISVTELCEVLEIPRKAFYRYFDSKDDALWGLIEHTMAEYELHTLVQSDERPSAEREMLRYFSFWRQQRPLLDALAASDRLTMIASATLRSNPRNAATFETLFPRETDQTRECVSRFALIGLVSMMLDWYRDGFRTSDTDMAALAYRLVTKPLLP